MADTFIALLRAINVGGRTLIMADLRDAARNAGLANVRTYIQSGNLIFTAESSEAEAEATIERLILDSFGLKAIALVRSARHFAAIASTNPFPDPEPRMLHMCLTKHPPNPDMPALLAPRAQAGERIALAGGAVWIDFSAAGVGSSKLLPASLDKAAGSTLTARNWNTVRKLIAMAEA